MLFQRITQPPCIPSALQPGGDETEICKDQGLGQGQGLGPGLGPDKEVVIVSIQRGPAMY